MTVHRQTLGKIGEDLAVAELTRRGYTILERRYRTRHGEIDIVAEDRGTIVFVEVKARATREFGTAAEAITPYKQRRLASMASEYLARQQVTDRPCRFDVVAIDEAESDTASITLYVGAFDANG
jgi:putative endonuclease